MMFCVARCRRAGFTLIEIMIVIAIIAILAAVVVPNVALARFEAGLTACQENCRIGFEAVQMARVRHTLEEVADMLDSGYGVNSTPFGYHYCYGYLGDKFVDAGYLNRPLRCAKTGSLCEYVYYEGVSTTDLYYRDWQKTEKIAVMGKYMHCTVCPGYHNGNSAYLYPCYEESIGACFM